MNPIVGLWRKFQSLRLVSKLIIGYVVMIVLPFFIFSVLFYREMNENLLSQFLSGKRQFMEQAYNSLEADLVKIESVYSLFQNNTALTEYLNGAYHSDWEVIYNYKKEILPVISFTYLGNKHISDIRIYKNKADVLSLNQDIVNVSELWAKLQGDSGSVGNNSNSGDNGNSGNGSNNRNSGNSGNNSNESNSGIGINSSSPYEEELRALKPKESLWLVEQQEEGQLPKLKYYRKLYTDTYSKELGYLEVTIGDEALKQFMSLLSNSSASSSILFADVQRHNLVVARQLDPGLDVSQMQRIIDAVAEGNKTSFYMNKNTLLITSAYLDKLNLRVIEISDTLGQFPSWRQKELIFVIVCGGLLAVLSAMYYLIVFSITKRIIGLSRHMKRVDFNNFTEYRGRIGPDEIGFLISSYNSLIRRVDELTNTVHKVELMKKEADFKMLQAQINPHFLYNTLETMRMHALQSDEPDVAEMAWSLGKLLRYSLSKSENDTTLRSELEHVEHYIAIHKIRMGARLEVQWHIAEEIADKLDEFRAPRFILQPMIENSIQHGLAKKRRKGMISISIAEQPEEIVITIADNGAGIEPERLEVIRSILDGSISSEQIPFSGGIGIHNVHERIKAFYGGSFGISMSSVEGEGAVCTIKVGKKRK
ncbi:sensor histidine kinase [Paenibacillus fonticola]|uniref:sensor histidine kinase n=1 Tax=Paenibacillus fonticola TaxID=379896 RepID=UPI000399F51F|nr:sensor histidine kinase [Paenibacillus fonticola]